MLYKGNYVIYQPHFFPTSRRLSGKINYIHRQNCITGGQVEIYRNHLPFLSFPLTAAKDQLDFVCSFASKIHTHTHTNPLRGNKITPKHIFCRFATKNNFNYFCRFEKKRIKILCLKRSYFCFDSGTLYLILKIRQFYQMSIWI